MRLLLAVVFLVWVQPSLAMMSDEAHTCPTVNDLKSKPFTKASYSEETGYYQPYSIDTYLTNDRWLFAVFVSEERDEQKALTLANLYLESLYGDAESAPDGHGGFTCFFMTDYGFAFAATPPMIEKTISKGAHYMQTTV